MLSVLPLLLSAPAIAFVFQGAGHTSFLAHQLPVQRVVRAGVSSMTAQRRFEVCQGKHCRKRGSKNTLALFEELAADSPGIIVQVCAACASTCGGDRVPADPSTTDWMPAIDFAMHVLPAYAQEAAPIGCTFLSTMRLADIPMRLDACLFAEERGAQREWEDRQGRKPRETLEAGAGRVWGVADHNDAHASGVHMTARCDKCDAPYHSYHGKWSTSTSERVVCSCTSHDLPPSMLRPTLLHGRRRRWGRQNYYRRRYWH
eukprot:6191400-Pleurochrysis_carterae.AAC.5